MKYKNVIKAKFLSRPNRFIAVCDVDGIIETVHVKNTGRCRELLLPAATVYLSVSDNPERKTKYDLIAVEKTTDRGVILINMDSQAPNEAAYEWLLSGGIFGENATVRREVTFGKSRFDLYAEVGDKRAFIEVKGVTLEKGGIASFPDAPTERGIKHIHELISAKDAGYEAYILFVVQMKGIYEFRPNDATHRAFGDALREAEAKGVRILAQDCVITPDEMIVDKPIKINLLEDIE